MKTIIDKLVPGSVGDVLILIAIGIITWLAIQHFGVFGATTLVGLGLQGNNETRRRRSKEQEEAHAAKAREHINEAMQAAEEATRYEEEINGIDNTEFVDNGESNEEIVNRIKRSGGL